MPGAFARLFIPELWNSLKNISQSIARSSRLGTTLGDREPVLGGIPPPPPRISGIITLARNSRQIRRSKELRGQNLENNGVRARRFTLEQTVTASTIIARIYFGGKVGCHNGICGKLCTFRNGRQAQHVTRIAAFLPLHSPMTGTRAAEGYLKRRRERRVAGLN